MEELELEERLLSAWMKSHCVNTTGSEKQQLMVIIKVKLMAAAEVRMFVHVIVIHIQEKPSVNETLMIEWIC